MNENRTLYLQQPLTFEGLLPEHIEKVDHKLTYVQPVLVENKPGFTVLSLSVTLTAAGYAVYTGHSKTKIQLVK